MLRMPGHGTSSLISEVKPVEQHSQFRQISQRVMGVLVSENSYDSCQLHMARSTRQKPPYSLLFDGAISTNHHLTASWTSLAKSDASFSASCKNSVTPFPS